MPILLNRFRLWPLFTDKKSVLLMCKLLESRQVTDDVIAQSLALVTSHPAPAPPVLETCGICDTGKGTYSHSYCSNKYTLR